MKKYMLLGAAVLVVIGLAVGLSHQRSQQEKSPIRIGLPIYPGWAPFSIAEQKGFFRKEGVNAEIIQIQDNNQLISSLASNDVQMLACSVDCAALMVDAGVEAVQVFATDESYGADGIVVKNEIHKIEDLKGKKVYLALGFPSHFLIRTLAERAGLTPDDITLENMDPDQVGVAFVAGKVDAGVTWEPWLSKASERPDGTVLLTSKDAPGIIVDTVFVRKDLLASRPDDVKAVVRAYFLALQYAQEHPTEANKTMGESIGLSAEEFAEQFALVKPLDYQANLKKFDAAQAGSVQTLTRKASEIYLRDGVITRTIDADSMVDTSILQDLY